MESYLALFISIVTVNNYVLSKYLGLCPFISVSKKIDVAFEMGLAVTFVCTISSASSYLIYVYLLKPFNIEYLDTIFFILVIAGTVQMVETLIEYFHIQLYKLFGIHLPLITTNCIVLGVAQFNVNYIEDPEYAFNFIQSVIHGFSAGVGFTLAIVLIASIRERLEFSIIPEAFRGAAITFISAGILALAFQGFFGLGK